MTMWKWISDLLSVAPPPWFIWLGASVAVLNFIVVLAAYRFNRANERTKRLNSVQDEFWFRKIAAPFFIEPYLEFLTGQQASFEALSVRPSGGAEVELYQRYMSAFRQAKKDIRCRLNFLKAVDPLTFKEISQAIRDLEDKVTLFCAENSGFGDPDQGERATKDDVISQFETTVIKSITVLKKSHRAMVDA